MNWHELIRTIPDWPKPGILFRDVTPLLQNGQALSSVIEELAAAVSPWNPAILVGAEARGFIFGAALAVRLGIGLVPIRKKGKLPAATIIEQYDLEYGTDQIEMHQDALRPGMRAVLVDDLLATGGTAAACARLINKAGAELAGIAFVIELTALGGAKQLPAGVPVVSLLTL